MRKVWVYKRKNIKGWLCGWYESGKRRSKALPSKELAEHYKQIKHSQLNSECFYGSCITRKTFEQPRNTYLKNLWMVNPKVRRGCDCHPPIRIS